MMPLIKLARAFRRVYHILRDGLVTAAGRSARRKSLLREQLAGSDPLASSKLAAVYVHYDPDGLIHDYVVHQLRELMEAGFRITFITNSPTFPASSRIRVFPFSKSIIWRLNTGYDFGAYKDGIASLGPLDQLEGLVLMNDSIYGPFWKLRETLAAADESHCDFWGITDSWEQRYHIQSFFVFFRATALRSGAFERFWRRLPYINDKGWVIRNGEILMTQSLMRQGLKAAVLAPYMSVAQTMKDQLSTLEQQALQPSDRSAFIPFQAKISAGRPVNPMQYFWDALIVHYRCPFIKRELLKSNPANIPLLSRWPRIIASQSTYDLGMIYRHLASLAAIDRGRS